MRVVKDHAPEGPFGRACVVDLMAADREVTAREPSVLREPAFEFTFRRPPVCKWPRLRRGDTGLGQQRKRDDGDFPEIDLLDTAHAAGAIAMRLDGAEADGKAVDGTGAHQREYLPGTGDRRHEAAAGEEAFGVLGERFPDADRLGRIVLEEHPHAAWAAGGQGFAEGAWHDDVPAEILPVEERGIAFEGAVIGNAFHVDGRELRFVRTRAKRCRRSSFDHDGTLRFRVRLRGARSGRRRKWQAALGDRAVAGGGPFFIDGEEGRLFEAGPKGFAFR